MLRRVGPGAESVRKNDAAPADEFTQLSRLTSDGPGPKELAEMKTIGLTVLAAVLATTGCSSSDDAPAGSAGGNRAPDLAALEAKLTTATGTFDAEQGASIRDALSRQSRAVRQNALPVAGATSSSTRSLGQLSPADLHTLDNGPSCPSLGTEGGSQTCPCSYGGTTTVDASPFVYGPGGRFDESSTAYANACGTSADRIVDGIAYVHIKSPPLVAIVSLHFVVSGKESARVDVDYLRKDGVTTYSVDVADGQVLVSIKGTWDDSTETGAYVVIDKNETWTCNLTQGKGECTSTSGATRMIGT
jgi:hypothetical protein